MILMSSPLSLVGESLIPSGGNLTDTFNVRSEGKGAGELNIATDQEGGVLVYSGSRGNITLAGYAPKGKVADTLADEVSLAFQLEGIGSLGFFFRSTTESAYLLLLNRSAEGQGSIRLFKRAESSQANFTTGLLASGTFEWPQSDDWYHLTLQAANQADGSVVLQIAISDQSKSLVAELNKSDLKMPLLNEGGITLRFYASDSRPATIKVGQLYLSSSSP